MYRIIGGDGREYGPISAEQLREWIAEGRVNAQTQARAEGSGDWRALSGFPEFAGLFGLASPAAGPSYPAGVPLAAPQPAREVSNYLVQAILCTLFCCLPGGIAAIIYAAQVNTKKAAGDFAGAAESASKAKMWCWISFGLGLAGALIYVALMVMGALAGAID